MSYNLSDAKWGGGDYGTGGGTVTWSVDWGDVLRFDGSTYDASDFDAALGAAFDAWSAVADIQFLQVADASESVMDISMSDLGGATVGLAQTSFYVLPGIDEYAEADIFFDLGEVWAPYGEGGLDFHAVALHEIGHAIGLGHVNDSSEIMNPVVAADELGDGDIAGVREIYGPAEAPTGGGLTPPPPKTTPDAPNEDTDSGADADGPTLVATPKDDGDDGGFDPFGWIFDFFSRLFGGGKDKAEMAEAAVEIGTHSHGVTLAELLSPDEIDAWLADNMHDHGDGHTDGHGTGCACCGCTGSVEDDDDGEGDLLLVA